MAGMAPFRWDPATYRALMRTEVPAYDELQDAVAGATRGIPVHRVLDLGTGTGETASRVLAFIVYEATPRDPLVLGGVVVAMVLLGLFATWIPAQRAPRGGWHPSRVRIGAQASVRGSQPARR